MARASWIKTYLIVCFIYMVLMAAMPRVVKAEEPVYFADANLKTCVEAKLGITNPTPTDMLALTRLDADQRGITDLTGLEYATNLTELWLLDNQISDISHVSGLTNLRVLYLLENQISDISALSGLINLQALYIRDNEISDISVLSGLTNLDELSVSRNQISDISVLSGLTNLTELYLYENQISDISALSGLTNLDLLWLQANPLNQDACNIYIQQIRTNNPGIRLQQDSCVEPPNPPTQAEIEDDIVCAFFYGSYRNPSVSGRWGSWGYTGSDPPPPKTWPSHYIPNYPDSIWDPNVQLYDSLDTEVLRWQGKAMARAGIDIAILSWYSPNDDVDDLLAKASRICKNVKWCISYGREGNYDPSPQKIYDDIKWVLDRNSHNYAKIDGKWLVFVDLFSQFQTSAEVQDAANRWSEAKEMLANDGYEVYLNADVMDEYHLPEHPWDAVHRFILFNPTDYQHFSNTVVDDSACVFPGYWWFGREGANLKHSLNKFKLALEQVVIDKEKYRFILIETWNEWVRGTQIEPGQEVIQDPDGYYPSGYNYGYDFIDAIAPIAINELHWQSSGHRPAAPVHLEAEEMIGDIDLEKDDVSCMIPDVDTRIGASVFSPHQSNMTFTVRAKAMLNNGGRLYPNMILYIDDRIAALWEVEPSAYGIYSAIVPLQKGIHKIEIGLDEPVDSDWDLAVDFLNILATQNYEGFETGDFSEFPWMYSGDSDWTITSSEKLSGTYSAKAGTIEDDESSALELTLNCTSGDITFSRKVSSESDYDYLRFDIDGVEQDKWSGEQDWEEVSFPVTLGQRTFKWIYSKDYSVSEGDDTAWIDDITFTIDD